MKKTIYALTAYISFLPVLIAVLFIFIVSQCSNPSNNNQQEMYNYSTDTSAVRAILDSNKLFTLSAVSVSDSSLGRITALHLNNKGLLKIPEMIRKLTALHFLNLEQNAIINIPSEIQSCKELTYINLNKNQIICPPAEIGHITSVKTFLINNNVLLELPGGIANNTALDTLDISHNLLPELPPEITGLTKLRYLDLGYNKLKNLSGALKTWADTFDPDWEKTQSN